METIDSASSKTFKKLYSDGQNYLKLSRDVLNLNNDGMPQEAIAREL